MLFAEERGLRLAALGVSPEARALFEQAGLRALYLGDEAIVDTGSFSLEGRPIRKVRQSVSRLQKAGYRTTLAELGSLDDADARRLEQIADDWRRGAPERGFAMAMDSLRNPHGERDARRRRDRRRPARSAASCTSCRRTAATRCRCRSCAATTTRRTG